jgi:hypothetical protein
MKAAVIADLVSEKRTVKIENGSFPENRNTPTHEKSGREIEPQRDSWNVPVNWCQNPG